MVQQKAPRKACDLCYNKRIKCDGKKPLCCHCVVYKSQCTYTAISRKASARKQTSTRGDGNLRSRLEHLETRLSEALENVKRLEGILPRSGIVRTPSSTVRCIPEDDAGSHEDHDRYSMELPPLAEVLPAVERYLATCNSVLPLFHARTLLRSVHDWYLYPSQRDCSTWAAINVVLALAYRRSNTADISSSRKTAEYLNRAQSVLTEVTMSGASLISVQVLAGLVLLYQGSLDLGPSTILVATALRLAHSLRLQSRTRSKCLDGAAARQRNRVFWMIYVLDRDISMRIQQPPLQRNSDIDLELPPEEPDDDDAGFILGMDGQSKFNFFRARVQLARIQGSLYDCLYSVRAHGASPEIRAHNMARVRHMLEDWASHVPQSFSIRVVLKLCPPEMSRYFAILYGTRLSCLSLVSLAHSWDARWMEKLRDYGSRARTGDTAMPLPLLAPLPEGWDVLVKESRDFLGFFMSIQEKDPSLIWMTSCSCIVGLISLTANNMCQPSHRDLESDRNTADMTLLHVEQMIEQASHGQLQSMGQACKELVRYDRIAFEQRQRAEMEVYAPAFLSSQVLPLYFVDNGAEYVFGQTEPVMILGPLYISSRNEAGVEASCGS